MNTPLVLTERRGAALWIKLNRPERRNALNDEVVRGISGAMAGAAGDPAVRVLVVTGAGDRAFCAGGDLGPDGAFTFDFARPRSAYGDLLRQAQDCPLPIIAAVNGACMAGGMGLLAMADVAVAVENATFGLPEARLGLFPMQVISLLKALVPPRRLREWALTGAAFDAGTAREAGLINRITAPDTLEATVTEIAEAMALCSPTALRRGKYAMRALDAMDFDEAIAFAEGQITLLSLTEDAREGLASFTEKRRPNFTGR